MQDSEIPPLGTLVADKYRLDRHLGQGGMGVVFAATDLTLQRPVALKLLLGVAAEQDVARFMREARATASLSGQHTARIYEAGVTAQGAPFIAMELLHGQDLDDLLGARGPLPVVEACDLLLQACEALAEAHAAGIVHRDLKPQNLFVVQSADGSRCLKVLDFGISKVAGEEQLGLTRTTASFGSPRYMSPEQVRSAKHVDARADIWALGTVLFELLSGRPLFDENTASALHAQIVADPAMPIRQLRPDVPPALEAVLLRCVEKDPTRRFEDVHAFGHALLPFASAAARHTHAGWMAPPRSLPSPNPAPRSRALLWLGAGLLAGGSVLGLWLALSQAAGEGPLESGHSVPEATASGPDETSAVAAKASDSPANASDASAETSDASTKASDERFERGGSKPVPKTDTASHNLDGGSGAIPRSKPVAPTPSAAPSASASTAPAQVPCDNPSIANAVRFTAERDPAAACRQGHGWAMSPSCPKSSAVYAAALLACTQAGDTQKVQQLKLRP